MMMSKLEDGEEMDLETAAATLKMLEEPKKSKKHNSTKTKQQHDFRNFADDIAKHLMTREKWNCCFDWVGGGTKRTKTNNNNNNKTNRQKNKKNRNKKEPFTPPLTRLEGAAAK